MWEPRHIKRPVAPGTLAVSALSFLLACHFRRKNVNGNDRLSLARLHERKQARGRVSAERGLFTRAIVISCHLLMHVCTCLCLRLGQVTTFSSLLTRSDVQTISSCRLLLLFLHQFDTEVSFSSKIRCEPFLATLGHLEISELCEFILTEGKNGNFRIRINFICHAQPKYKEFVSV